MGTVDVAAGVDVGVKGHDGPGGGESVCIGLGGSEAVERAREEAKQRCKRECCETVVIEEEDMEKERVRHVQTNIGVLCIVHHARQD